MATKHVASWVCDLQYSHLPPEVVRAAVQSFYNWAGCAIGGSNHEAVQIAHKALRPFFGPPTASILGHKGAVLADPQHAALLNGIASHVHDYDDTHLDTIIHPTGPVASALVAAAEWHARTNPDATATAAPVSGKAFLTALVAGIEVECKLGLAVWPQHYDVGWHITSTTGSIGAAVAVAKLLGLDHAQTVQAVGVAATQVVGLRDMFGSHTKSFHPGRAAQAGLLAALLARQGYTSSETPLEAKRGWANVVGATKGDDAIQADLTNGGGGGGEGGGRWEILRNSFKPFPCGIVIHPVIDGCAQIHQDMQRQGLGPQDVERVDAKVHSLVLELTGKTAPQDGLQAKFSVYHGGACGLLFGKATPSQYEDAVVQDPAVIAVRDRIRAETDPSLAADETKIVVTLKGGRTLEKHVKHAVGSLEVPLDEQRLQAKFLDQCQTVLGEHTERASKALWALEEVDDVSSIVSFL
ncbi:mmge/prpd family protein-like protein [Coniella lustricola]|uniref:Mmge/prpd family protein-like protein n=1 Tax=Coniella lustricola TaxID=2025994 RepID=A0A2T3A897_9PEZI|nr:mmge/prpd family protein-like protein [Coniella lustricola]